jgi:hypothetical protein
MNRVKQVTYLNRFGHQCIQHGTTCPGMHGIEFTPTGYHKGIYIENSKIIHIK